MDDQKLGSFSNYCIYKWQNKLAGKVSTFKSMIDDRKAITVLRLADRLAFTWQSGQSTTSNDEMHTFGVIHVRTMQQTGFKSGGFSHNESSLGSFSHRKCRPDVHSIQWMKEACRKTRDKKKSFKTPWTDFITRD